MFVTEASHNIPQLLVSVKVLVLKMWGKMWQAGDSDQTVKQCLGWVQMNQLQMQ